MVSARSLVGSVARRPKATSVSIVQINLLSVPEGMGSELEKRFADRRRALDGTPGFEGFDLLRPTSGDNDRYMVLTRWRSQEDFENWLDSRDFQQGHATTSRQASDDGEQAHASERPEGGQGPAATDSELWGFEVVDLDATATDEQA